MSRCVDSPNLSRMCGEYCIMLLLNYCPEGEVASSVFVFSHPKQNEIRSTQYLKAMLQQKIMKGLWSLWLHFLMGEEASLGGSGSAIQKTRGTERRNVI